MNAGDRFIVGLLFFLFSATAITASSVHVEGLYCDTGPFRLSLPKTVDALRKIGPLKNDRLLQTFRWGDNTESQRRELEFDGLSLVIHADSSGHRYSVDSATISSPRWSVAPNFKVGDQMNDVLQRLGLSSVPPDQLVFEGDTDSVSFDVEQDRIQQIRIRCYTG